MADPRFASTNLEGYRVSLIDSTGAFQSVDPGLYACTDGISFQNAFVTQEGTTYQQNTGAGIPCVNRVGPTRVTGATVTVSVCSWQFGLMGMLMGGKVAYDGDGNAIGWSMPDPDAATVQRFVLEAWTLAVDGEVQASNDNGDALWIHHIWPQATCIPADFTLEDAVTPFGIICSVTPNPLVASGPFDDWALFDNDNLLDGHPTGPYAAYYDTDPPSALCTLEALTDPGS